MASAVRGSVLAALASAVALSADGAAAALVCPDGNTLTPVAPSACPPNPDALQNDDCDVAAVGDLCEADGECGTNANGQLDNCGVWDIYLKGPPGSTTPTVTATTVTATTTVTSSTVTTTSTSTTATTTSTSTLPLWQRCVCPGGIEVQPVAPEDCPLVPAALLDVPCNGDVAPGELCNGHEVCPVVNNCGPFDVYRRPLPEESSPPLFSGADRRSAVSAVAFPLVVFAAAQLWEVLAAIGA